jgi:hypothetical protein
MKDLKIGLLPSITNTLARGEECFFEEPFRTDTHMDGFSRV